ncbi:MAG: hypothetical protein GY703_00315 [Gammaproteobacteria bacterium]|nr:hypothetical protein [Gammaproteobacteria bacterium]
MLRKDILRRFSTTVLSLGVTTGTWAIVDKDQLSIVAEIEPSHAEHCDEVVAAGNFNDIFVCGDEFFEVDFIATDGGGANVGNGQRYTRTPRADLRTQGQWATHFPQRPTGPNSASCGECHSFPAGTAAGRAGFNVMRDPFHTGDPGRMINRNTPHLMGSGALQLLAEEITADLAIIVQEARTETCATGSRTERSLFIKGVNFGELTIELDDGFHDLRQSHPDRRRNHNTHQGSVGNDGDCRIRMRVESNSIDHDLVIRPYQWKGSDLSLREFVRTAFNNEIGMQPVEITGDGYDGDFDGIVDEVSIADVTATTIYVAGQPRPVTKIELHQLRADLTATEGKAGATLADELNLPDLTETEINAIQAGEATFKAIGCSSCHRPSLPLSNPVYQEPSQSETYRDATFPAGQDPITSGLDPNKPITFDLTLDLPDNHIELGRFFRNIANFETDQAGNAVVQLYGDLRRHDMGPELAEQIDEKGTGRATFMTKELWGVGSTTPYLHDGRATTLTEAILLHGGDAQRARDTFSTLPLNAQTELVRFLANLVIFKVTEE